MLSFTKPQPIPPARSECHAFALRVSAAASHRPTDHIKLGRTDAFDDPRSFPFVTRSPSVSSADSSLPEGALS